MITAQSMVVPISLPNKTIELLLGAYKLHAGIFLNRQQLQNLLVSRDEITAAALETKLMDHLNVSSLVRSLDGLAKSLINVNWPKANEHHTDEFYSALHLQAMGRGYDVNETKLKGTAKVLYSDLDFRAYRSGGNVCALVSNIQAEGAQIEIILTSPGGRFPQLGQEIHITTMQDDQVTREDIVQSFEEVVVWVNKAKEQGLTKP